MILLIDNYDSFVYNLARYFAELGCDTAVVRNDEITAAEVLLQKPAAIVLSPGPCTPAEAGVCVDVVSRCGPSIPVLGVCLGHQSIAAACGATIVRADAPVHGRTSAVEHDGSGLFAGLPQPLIAARYHSLVVDESTLPACLRVTARTADRAIMALQHREWPIHGVQFHPESVLTQSGHHLLSNFLAMAGIPANPPAAAEWTAPATDDDFFALAIDHGVPRPID